VNGSIYERELMSILTGTKKTI